MSRGPGPAAFRTLVAPLDSSIHCGLCIKEIEGESGAARAGSVEGAALSGLRLAEQLQLAM